VSLPIGDRRRERWRRFEPYSGNLYLLFSEIGDDLDEQDERWDRLDKRVARLTGIALGLLISTSTGVLLLALNLVVKGGTP
jgi:hypothetical protein